MFDSHAHKFQMVDGPTNTEPPISRLVTGCHFDSTGRKHLLGIAIMAWPNEGSFLYECVSADGMRTESVEHGSWFRRILANETSMLSVDFPDTGEVDRDVLNLLMADLVKRGFADEFVEEGTF